MKKIKTISKQFKVLVLVVILAILASSYFFLVHRKDNNAATSPTKPAGLINLNPPTAQEKASGDKIKSQINSDEARRNAPQSAGKITVKPTITYAGQYKDNVELGAFVNGVYEDSGTCTLTLQKDNESKTSVVNAVKGATSMDCPVMSVPRATISAGTWSASVSYSSSSAEGVSDVRPVEVK